MRAACVQVVRSNSNVVRLRGAVSACQKKKTERSQHHEVCAHRSQIWRLARPRRHHTGCGVPQPSALPCPSFRIGGAPRLLLCDHVVEPLFEPSGRTELTNYSPVRSQQTNRGSGSPSVLKRMCITPLLPLVASSARPSYGVSRRSCPRLSSLAGRVPIRGCVAASASRPMYNILTTSTSTLDIDG